MSWEDNPFLKKSEIARMEKSLSEGELESRKYGRFMEAEGLVFTEFNEENIVEPFELGAGWEVTLSIDPGYVAPTGAVWLAQNGEDMLVIADYSVAQKTVEQHAASIIQKTKDLGLDTSNISIIMDSAALQKTLGSPTSVANQFRAHGLDVQTAVNKSVIEGIQKLKALLKNVDGVRRLRIFRSCVNLLRELRGYYWGDDERPVKRDDHCIDALRYAVMTNKGETKSRTPSQIAWSKKILINHNKGVLSG